MTDRLVSRFIGRWILRIRDGVDKMADIGVYVVESSEGEQRELEELAAEDLRGWVASQYGTGFWEGDVVTVHVRSPMEMEERFEQAVASTTMATVEAHTDQEDLERKMGLGRGVAAGEAMSDEERDEWRNWREELRASAREVVEGVVKLVEEEFPRSRAGTNKGRRVVVMVDTVCAYDQVMVPLPPIVECVGYQIWEKLRARPQYVVTSAAVMVTTATWWGDGTGSARAVEQYIKRLRESMDSVFATPESRAETERMIAALSGHGGQGERGGVGAAAVEGAGGRGADDDAEGAGGEQGDQGM